MTKPCDMPRHTPEHLIWRLESKGEDAVTGWFLFDGRQVRTIVSALRRMTTLIEEEG